MSFTPRLFQTCKSLSGFSQKQAMAYFRTVSPQLAAQELNPEQWKSKVQEASEQKPVIVDCYAEYVYKPSIRCKLFNDIVCFMLKLVWAVQNSCP